jgi:hypothetical protein
MAFYPCSNHHAPYRGPAAAAYPALVDGASTDRKHLRMCQPCFADYLAAAEARLAEVEYDKPGGASPEESSACSWCGEKWGKCPTAVFLTAYPTGEAERSFYGRTCRECESAAKAELLLS